MSEDLKISENKIFAPIKNKWLFAKPEEIVRQKYINRLINQYGYSIEQMAQELQVTNSQRGQGRAMADIAIFKSAKDKSEGNSPLIIVECKAEHITIREEDYFQGYNYASWAGADFFVTTNLKETKIFRVLKGKVPKTLEEIIDIPDKSTISNTKKTIELLNQTKSFTRDEFSKLLFKCHNIIRNNDKLSPEAAFDEISKVLFIKIRYERGNDEAQIFSKKQFEKDRKSYDGYKVENGLSFYQNLFEKIKSDYKYEDLFDKNESIRIRENSFEAIVGELEIYNLSTTSDDIKGIAFEKFLGKTFRGELGQFFTPRTIVDFMVTVLDPEEGEIICDPCCGSGGFLIKAFEYVREKIEKDIHSVKKEIKDFYYNKEYDNLPDNKKSSIDFSVENHFNNLNSELNSDIKNSRMNNLSHNCIFGTDANPRMSRTAKMNMIMHGDGHGGVHHNDGLLNINGIFENRFDVILTNPPFGSRVDNTLLISELDKYSNSDKIKEYTNKYGKSYIDALNQINNNLGKPLINLYQTGKMSGLTEVLFIERCINLLKPGGRMGIVLPEGVLNNSNLDKVRQFFESKAKIILITSIPQDVFTASGASVKPSIVFLKKFTEEESSHWKKLHNNIQEEIKNKYENEISTLNKIISKRASTDEEKSLKKESRKRIKDIEKLINDEVYSNLRKQFNYEIPIADITKAGISSTGSPIENQLIPLVKEFKLYRSKNNLWSSNKINISYIYSSTETIKSLEGQEVVL